jgi:hypothetical protein
VVEGSGLERRAPAFPQRPAQSVPFPALTDRARPGFRLSPPWSALARCVSPQSSPHEAPDCPAAAGRTRRMTSRRYQVQIPIEALAIKTPGVTHTCSLPARECQLGDMVVRPANGGRHEVILTVATSDVAEAKQAAASIAEDLINLCAAQGENLQLLPWEATAAALPPQDVSITARPPHSWAVEFSTGLSMSAHLTLAKTRGSFDLEAKWLQGRERWPESLRRALAVNRLATVSSEPAVRFLLWMMTLESLAGRPKPLLDGQQLDYKALERALQSALGLEAPGLERVIRPVWDTEEHSAADRLHGYLRSVGCPNVTAADAGRWWRWRGELAHGAPITGEVTDELPRLSVVVQSALRYEIETRAGDEVGTET